MPRGKIVNLIAQSSSGIAILMLKEKGRGIVEIPCDNGPTVRAFQEAWGGVIGPGHTVIVTTIKGKVIDYELTAWGTLMWFDPVEDK